MKSSWIFDRKHDWFTFQWDGENLILFQLFPNHPYQVASELQFTKECVLLWLRELLLSEESPPMSHHQEKLQTTTESLVIYFFQSQWLSFITATVLPWPLVFFRIPQKSPKSQTKYLSCAQFWCPVAFSCKQTVTTVLFIHYSISN